jgi:hypothetical protein
VKNRIYIENFGFDHVLTEMTEITEMLSGDTRTISYIAPVSIVHITSIPRLKAYIF